MAHTIFVYIESVADVPLIGASPTFTYWDKSSPGAPVASGQAMTELVGGAGGVYFVDVATVDGKEYAGQIDATAGAAAGTRYRLATFSGTLDARLEVDIPAILAAMYNRQEVDFVNQRLVLYDKAGTSIIGYWPLADGDGAAVAKASGSPARRGVFV